MILHVNYFMNSVFFLFYFQKYKKPKFIQCFVFSLTEDVLTGDSEGNILTWGKSAADIKTLGKGAKGWCILTFYFEIYNSKATDSHKSYE